MHQQDEQLRAIIFDWGGVFDSKHESLNGFAAVAIRLGIPAQSLYDKLYNSDSWRAARVGDITDDQWLQLVMAELEPGRNDLAAFRSRLFGGQAIDAAVVDLARRLHADYQLALISNATDRLETVLDQHGLGSLFDLVVNSARVGIAKPDPRIYELTLRKLGIKPQEALFIDDKPRNIAAAVELSIPSILFAEAAQLEAALLNRGILRPRS
ncbi:MAG: hypothetical protein NVS2B7_25370 [Herpetosiphon sp.]